MTLSDWVRLFNFKMRNEILLFVTIWVDPEGIMLSEVSQEEKDKYHMVSLRCGIWKQNKTKKAKKQTHRPKGYSPEEKGWGLVEEGKGNVVKNIVGSLHSDRWLLELVGWSHCKV